MLKVQEVVSKGFTLAVVHDSKTPAVSFSGNGDSEAIEPLKLFLKALDKELLAKRETSVAMNLKDLYFMNSSCLKAFVAWIYGVSESGKPYRIRLQTNPRLHWQARSMATLQRLAPKVVQIEELTSMAPGDDSK
jgi:hypothetical protein